MNPESAQNITGRDATSDGSPTGDGTEPREIGLVAIDLDGTLLNDRKEVTDQVADALRCLPSKGVKVVIASARPPRSVRRIYQRLGLDTWQINYNGAMVWDEPAKKVIAHVPLKAELCRQMIDQARDLFDEVLVSGEILDKWCTDRVDDAYLTETAKLYRKPDMVAPVDQWCIVPLTKLMFQGDAHIMARLESTLIENYADQGVTILRQEDELIQIMDSRVSKGIALSAVARYYGVPLQKVMAIGDAPNDVGMLQVAGVGVAMGNAYEVVKSVADWIAPSNNDHGVHAALRRYGLCG